MTKDTFSSAPIVLVPVAEITIPPDRQRSNAKADDGLISSIETNGLLNPIILNDDKSLIAGERRLDAFRQLKRSTIPARFFSQLNQRQAHLVELQENLQREDLTWQELARSIERQHRFAKEEFAGWTDVATANEIGLSNTQTSRYLAVAAYLHDPDIAGASTLTGAHNLLESRANRSIAAATARGLLAADDVAASLLPPDASKEEKTQHLMNILSGDMESAAAGTSDLLGKLERGAQAEAALEAAATIQRSTAADDDRIQQVDFIEWAESYSGPPFDVIHCDFPYGKNYSGSRTRRTGKATIAPAYADKADVLFALVEAFTRNQDRFCLPQAHCIFWFDMVHYCWLKEHFTAAGWKLAQPHPLIWTKNFQGVASDVERRPRHCYETALLLTRGDRRIRSLTKDYWEERVDEKLHISQKPIDMLTHFLQLVVDEHTDVLDPTCGSGTALVAAAKLKAARILGLELDESNVDVARFILQRELGGKNEG